MWSSDLKPRISSFAPQFLVDDLTRSITFYQKLGFFFDEPHDAFYAVGVLDNMIELHLKQAPKNQSERLHRRANLHVDASAGVHGIELFFKHLVDEGVPITKSLGSTESGTLDFHVEDPDGYIICFAGPKSIAMEDIERVRECLRRDVGSTLGHGYDEVIFQTSLRVALYTDDAAYYRDRVVGDVQQHFHDSFIDTVWPACPHHANHPLWLHGEDWRCEQSGVAVARLGELGRDA